MEVRNPVASSAGAVTLSGTPTVGQVLTANVTGLSASGRTYEWRRNGAAISGATSSTYTLVQADAGAQITCVVTGTVPASPQSGAVTAASSSVVTMVAAASFAYAPTNTAQTSAAAAPGGLTETHRMIHTALATGAGVKLRYVNDSSSATLYVAAAVEPTLGATPVPVTFGGQAEVTIPPRTAVDSDALTGVSLTAGQQFATRARPRVANENEKIVYGNNLGGSGKGGKVAGDSLTGTVANSATYLFGAVAIGLTGATTTAKQVGLSMDSFNQHWPARKWEGVLPLVNMGRSGEGSQAVVTTRLTEVLAGLAGVPNVVVGYGHNDLLSHPSLAGMQANLLTLWKAHKNNGAARLIGSTICPHTDSTDNWRTETNQVRTAPKTSTDEQVRQDYNAWLRDGAPLSGSDLASLTVAAVGASGGSIVRVGTAPHPLAAYVDAAAQVEATGTTGKWKTFAEATGDTTSGSTTITNVNTTKGTWVVGQDIRGAAGIPSTTVTAVGAGTLTIASAATATGTGVQIAAPSTSDGLHPTLNYARDLIAAVFPDSSLQ